MSYIFKGYDWTELANCWGIEVKEKPLIKDSDLKISERIDITKYINGMMITFTVDEYDEVLAEKVKNHIKSNLDLSSGNFKDDSMRDDIHNFLKSLIKESRELDYNYPVFEGILKIEDDYTLMRWICDNLHNLWT